MARHFYVDASNQVAGKLSNFIAKSLLEGNKVTVVHSENVVFTGPIERGMKKYESYLRKRRIVNPLKGQFHYKQPSKYFKRVIKRMVPKKKTKGHEALKRLRIFEGCPEKYYEKEFFQAPKALLKQTADPRRKHYVLADLLRRFGWKDYDLVKRLNNREAQIKKVSTEKAEKKNMKIEEIRNSAEYAKKVEEIIAKFE